MLAKRVAITRCTQCLIECLAGRGCHSVALMATAQDLVEKKRKCYLGVISAAVVSYEQQTERVWCKEWLQKRRKFSSFNTLFKELEVEGHDDFKDYLRLTPDLFVYLLELIKPTI